jgi:Zn-dependent M16 (insulinase) family peptidase
MKTEADSSLAPMGHMYASGRASRMNSLSKKTEEAWSGLSQLEFVHRLAALAESDIDAVSQKLQSLREKISGFGLIANITGGNLDAAGSEFAQRFGRFGPPLERASSPNPGADATAGVTEVFASQSLQVGFAARTVTAAAFDTDEQTAEGVLAHQLSTGALWENIRMKGGAYGAFAGGDSLENCFTFATYRDPSPLRSLDAVSSILKDRSFGDCTEDYLVKSIIGCYGKETRPRTGAENGLVDFYRFLYGVEDGFRKRKLERLVGVTTDAVAAAFASLAERQQSGVVIIAGAKTAQDAAKALGVDVQTLPV